MRMLCEAGVDALITNYPDIAKKIRDEYRLENCSLNWFKESFRVETVRDTYDRKRAENIMIPEEANYQRTMKRDVEPYLRSYEKTAT